MMASVSTVLAAAGSSTIPDDTGGPYVVAAYLVFVVLIAVYVAIMAQRLSKVSRAAADLEARLDAVQAAGGARQPATAHNGGMPAGATTTREPTAPTTTTPAGGTSA